MPSKSTLKRKNPLKGSFVKASLINHAIFLFSLKISRYLAGYPENSLSGRIIGRIIGFAKRIWQQISDILDPLIMLSIPK